MYTYQHHKIYRIGPFKTSEIELQDLFKAWIAISVAFAIVIGSSTSFQTFFSVQFLYNFLLAAFTVGIGFLFHELGHKLVAQRYGCFAEFRAWDTMLLLAIVMSFLGFVFAAPGAVMISGHVDRVRNGRISIAGPGVNIVLALIFLGLILALGNTTFFYYGLLINAWLGLFNMIPFGNLDGKKVLLWNKAAYALVVIAAAILLFGINLIV
ncbi:MAG TPA: metalloprotease [Candidatus Nanoarchaeia archaeon]|nr:metalloprotease [Candidatus Nanoarchaeia archaeon]